MIQGSVDQLHCKGVQMIGREKSFVQIFTIINSTNLSAQNEVSRLRNRWLFLYHWVIWIALSLTQVITVWFLNTSTTNYWHYLLLVCWTMSHYCNHSLIFLARFIIYLEHLLIELLDHFHILVKYKFSKDYLKLLIIDYTFYNDMNKAMLAISEWYIVHGFSLFGSDNIYELLIYTELQVVQMDHNIIHFK